MLRKIRGNIRWAAWTAGLAFVLTVIPAAAAERKGAELKILRNDGSPVSGELIGVGEKALILKNRENGSDIRVAWEDISKLELHKKPSLGTGILLGAATGLLAGVALAGGGGKSTGDQTSRRKFVFWGATFSGGNRDFLNLDSKAAAGMAGVFLGAAAGGGLAFAVAGKTYRVADQSARARQAMLKDLHAQARIPEYR